jgi:hypothetical protein
VNINPQSNTDFTQVTCTVHFYYISFFLSFFLSEKWRNIRSLVPVNGH